MSTLQTNKKVVLPTLKTVFADSHIDLRGINWNNVNILGDTNIELLIKEIIESDKRFLSDLKNVGSNSKVSAANKRLLEKQTKIFVDVFKEVRKEIVTKLQESKTGEIKPLIPNLRGPKTFVKKHVVMFPYKNVHTNPAWRSMLATSSSNTFGNERYHLTSFKNLVDNEIFEDQKANFSACGHYWQIEIQSCTIMSYDELMFFKQSQDEPFIKLWFSNSEDRDFKKLSEFQSIINEPFEELSESDFSEAITNLIVFMRKAENFPEDEVRNMQRIADNIERDFA